jgi:hypothetical protein
MPFVPGKKKAFLMPSGPPSDPYRNHLFAVLTDASKSGSHLLVPICTIKPNRYFDNACEIAVGEHPFITGKSYIEYRLITVRPSSHIVSCIDGMTFHPKEDVTESLYQRICAGIDRSRHIPRWAKIDFHKWPDC